MKCPCCGAADLVHEKCPLHFECGGETIEIPDVEGDYCPTCREVLMDAENGNRYHDLAHAFEEKVRKGGARALTG